MRIRIKHGPCRAIEPPILQRGNQDAFQVWSVKDLHVQLDDRELLHDYGSLSLKVDLISRSALGGFDKVGSTCGVETKFQQKPLNDRVAQIKR